jgi:DNA-directed RNA polymerase subunit RPC12/RpoP
MLILLRRLWCALRGHNELFDLDAVGPFVRCPSCGYRSPGIDVTPSPRIVRAWRFQRRVMG